MYPNNSIQKYWGLSSLCDITSGFVFSLANTITRDFPSSFPGKQISSVNTRIPWNFSSWQWFLARVFQKTLGWVSSSLFFFPIQWSFLIFPPSSFSPSPKRQKCFFTTFYLRDLCLPPRTNISLFLPAEIRIAHTKLSALKYQLTLSKFKEHFSTEQIFTDSRCITVSHI